MNWEYGSDPHWAPLPDGPPVDRAPWAGGVLFGTGRHAMIATLDHGCATRGWKRLWVPAFFCQEVVASLRSVAIEIESFNDNPIARQPALPHVAHGDAVLLVNYFGTRSDPGWDVPPGVDIIEDHTHDPASEWARNSQAAYCVASLRKTLPLPEGGVAWSPRGLPLPREAPVTLEHALATQRRLAGMLLKRLYLAGAAVKKEEFRSLLVSGEVAIGGTGVSGMLEGTKALLRSLPVTSWRTIRGQNHSAMLSRLRGTTWLQALDPSPVGGVPSGLYLILDCWERREYVRERLIQHQVYPTILWSLEQVVVPIDSGSRLLSRRVLCLPCDARYSSSEVETVVDLLVKCGSEWPGRDECLGRRP